MKSAKAATSSPSSSTSGAPSHVIGPPCGRTSSGANGDVMPISSR